jgi:hypothetical protein
VLAVGDVRAATSSGWLRRWGRGRSRSASSTASSRNEDRIG